MPIRIPSLAVGPVALAAASTAGTVATQAQNAAPAGNPPPIDEAPFLAENAAAMNKMMVDMDLKPTGDVHVDFAAMMIPHHQGAVDMAVAYLRYGRNEQLRRLAQEIVVEQRRYLVIAEGTASEPGAVVQRQTIN